MKNAKVTILGWLGWYARGGRGVIEHCESGFLSISVKICLKLTYIPKFIKIRWKMPKLPFWGGWGGMSGWYRGDRILQTRISLYLHSNPPQIDLITKFHQNRMKTLKVSILVWLGWYAGVGSGVIKNSQSGFLFISVQICLKLIYIPNIIKIGWKTPKLAFWGGWGGVPEVVGGDRTLRIGIFLNFLSNLP